MFLSTVKPRGREKKEEKKIYGFFSLISDRKPVKLWNISYQIGFVSF